MPTDDFKAAESAAPVNTSGPLPLTVQTLEFIPLAKRDHYARKMDGSFSLAWINLDDPHYAAYVAHPGLLVLPRGETPQQQDEAEAQQQAEVADRQRMVDEDWARLQAEAKARKEARRAAEHARIEAQYPENVAKREAAQLAEISAAIAAGRFTR